MDATIFALFAPLFTGLGMVIQRRAHIKFSLRNVFKSRLWLSGIILDALGFLMYSLALSVERISIVQPLLVLSLAVTAIVERLLRQTKNTRTDYLAILLVTAGILLVI